MNRKNKVVCDNGLSDGQIELTVFPNKKIVQFEVLTQIFYETKNRVFLFQ